MFVSRCIFLDGYEVVRGPDCPHGRDRDELGEIKEPGWTVQQVPAPPTRGPEDSG